MYAKFLWCFHMILVQQSYNIHVDMMWTYELFISCEYEMNPWSLIIYDKI
jgi:hypothetical protein